MCFFFDTLQISTLTIEFGGLFTKSPRKRLLLSIGSDDIYWIRYPLPSSERLPPRQKPVAELCTHVCLSFSVHFESLRSYTTMGGTR